METVFDSEQVLARRRRALARPVEGADFLMRQAAEDLALRLSTTGRTFQRAGLLHCITPHAHDVLEGSGKVRSLVSVEADPAFPAFAGDTRQAGPETVGLEPQSLDLAVSLLTLQDVNDTPGMLAQIRKSLKPDGLFLGAMLGTGTLAELRESLLAAETEVSGGAAPRLHPLADVRAAGALLQRAGFALPVTDFETVTVRYANALSLMHDLRAMAATNALHRRSRKPLRRAVLERAVEVYAERFSDPDGRIRATFSIVWLSGWAPDASQQKPLKPGSASHSLASALNRTPE
ncbi:SAM-dependent methyltransferase [Zhengella mangrovi]|uniref:SAM-dependent methyltransferase n=1 Tax=Zhengella mangrovi TaxID=1982044 RepID=A0A2G1QJA8_9HYPH|nr:methyltransferase domain-containing protein [Zhengella mangrovi]PHP65613.1 SAM-dependent methyltransferase [Zhengella mangrovi]